MTLRPPETPLERLADEMTDLYRQMNRATPEELVGLIAAHEALADAFTEIFDATPISEEEN
jgi:hypothetical protein